MTKINTPPHFFLRLIERADNEEVARVIREVMMEFGAVGEGYSINDPEVDHMYEAYNGDRSVFFVLCRDHDILGCGGIGPLKGADEEVCELRKMYFRPVARGLGWGKKMLERCLDEARQRGYQQCYLETVERMTQANKLYQRMGFRRLDTSMGNTGHGSCDSNYVLDLS
ncbi:MAG: GNAT family N-acetyltransferase [Bacteroidota bacterium]